MSRNRSRPWQGADFLAWQIGTDAYNVGTRQGLLEEPKGFEHTQSTDIPRPKEEKHPLPKGDLGKQANETTVHDKSELVD